MIPQHFQAALPSLAAARPAGSRCLLSAERIFTGQCKKSLSPGAVLIDGDRIVAVGDRAHLRRQGVDEELQFDDCTLLPGLIDAHVHLSLRHGENIMEHMDSVSEEAAHQQCGWAASRMLRAGVTTVRDLGCRGRLGQRFRDAVVAGETPGPRVLTSGQPITSCKGHFWPIGIEVKGSAEAARAVDALASDEVDLIKIMATGGALTPGTHMGRAQFDAEEMASITAAAHDHGLPVAAHAHGTEGILLAVDAGAHTIEHCSWTDRDAAILPPDAATLATMRENGQMVVVAGPLPPGILDHADTAGLERSTSPQKARFLRMLALWRNAAQALEAGVGVTLGTDSIFGEFEDGHDLIYRAEALVRFAQWDPVDVLWMMTSAGARALCATGRIGCLGPGAFADLLVVSGSPHEDIAALHNTEAVFLAGRRVV